MSDASFMDDLPDDPDAALAAEFVLRLLDPAEEAACAARIASDRAFADEVDRWQEHFAGLDAAFNPAAPPAGMRARVEERLFGRPASLASRLWSSAGLWRGVAAAAVVAAAVVGFLGRPVPVADPYELIATVTPITGDVQLVAFVDRQAHVLRFTRLAGNAPPGRSFELWLLPEGETVPQSLGVVPAESRFGVTVPDELAVRVGPGTQILVSDEAEGGSQTGVPGPVVAGGSLNEV